jgi:tripartite-type tricarboxylate transporter receptor subunit TctC
VTGAWRSRRLGIAAIIVAAISLHDGSDAAAQDKWPSRPVTLVVPVGPGTITDIVGRLLADQLKNALGQPVVVENKPGAGATIGARYVARAPADGYTLLVGGNTTHSSVPSLFKEMPYDPVTDFTPIARVGLLGQYFGANPQQPFKTIQDMVAFAKVNPGKLSYGYGNASGQIVGETLKFRLGINLTRVPYASNPNALTDLLSNSIQLVSIDYLSGVPLAEAGRVVPLAVFTKSRYSKLPDTPTLDETVLPGFELAPWLGLFGPPNLPQDIVVRVSDALGKLLSDQAFVASLRELGPEPYYLPAGPFTAFVKADIPVWTEHARIAGIEPR